VRTLSWRRVRPGGVASLCHGLCVDEDLWHAYDRMGVSFAQHAADSAYNAHYDRPAVLAALGPVTDRRVLDAACGPGLYLRELLERGAKVTAFDASPVMVRLARQVAADRARIDQAALGEPLPYPDSAFDLIVCALAVHYARDRAAAFAEFCRVLRPGGAAVVSTQHPVMDWLRKGGSYFQTTLETDLWHTPAGDQLVHFWREPLSALCTAATGAGFLIEKLIEPVPAETMRERYPEDYEQLSREPGFLILRLLKPAAPDLSPPD
jgi:SAM-dependent methyltransferase